RGRHALPGRVGRTGLGPPTYPPAWAVSRRGGWTAHGQSQPLASHGAARAATPYPARMGGAKA
ncbi:MAG: hypothetical protein WCO57_13445, partial [Verrucomicrobiota bacterium]